jgi:polar amino acid transport system substrate-binding protein
MPNNLNSRRWLVLTCFLAGLHLLVGCAAPRPQTVKTIEIPPDANLLRVGVATNAPPLIYKQDGKIVGLEAEFAQALAQYIGKSLRFVELDWKDLIPALMENKIDIIMSGMTKTREREWRIAFTNRYLGSGQTALIRRKDAARFSTGLFSWTTTSAIGVIKDTTGEFFVDTQFSSVKKVAFRNSQAATRALINNEIDMFIHDAPIIFYLASENETNGLTALFVLLQEEDLAWAVRKDNKDLLNSANKFLTDPNQQEMIKKMTKFWIPIAK